MLKAQVIGHIGGDAAVNNVNGKVVINFSVAHSEKYKDKNGVDQNKTEWVSCSYWTDRTAIVTYLKKGQQVYVEGQISCKTYSGQQNQVLPQLTLRVQSIQLLGGVNNQQRENTSISAPTSSQPTYANQQEENVDDLPF